MLLAAPIQEYTVAAFRNAHYSTIGGIDEYYTPFIRLEHGTIPKRSATDIASENNRCNGIVPQILVKTIDETATLLKILADYGYRRTDLNIGCPFPKVVKSGYGAALLTQPDTLRDILACACKAVPDIQLSVKMRLGLTSPDDAFALLPILNDVPLCQIVLHPRTAIQQYDGMTDRNAFRRFQADCRHPVFYNGDIRTPDDAAGMTDLMLGRGLLANPLLPLQLRGTPSSAAMLQDFHKALVDECTLLYQQPLQKLKLFWDYLLPEADKRLRKAIQKATQMQDYLAVAHQILITEGADSESHR